MTSTRITPDQLLPDVGGWYRHRDTGRRLRLYMISGPWVFLMSGTDNSVKRERMSEFINKWIHDGSTV